MKDFMMQSPKYKVGDRKYIIANHGDQTEIIPAIHLIEILKVETIILYDGYLPPYAHRYQIKGFKGHANGFDKIVSDLPENEIFDSFNDAKNHAIQQAFNIVEYRRV